MTFLDAAEKYLTLGWSPIPLKERDKTPVIDWKDFQKRRPSTDEVREWWTRWPNANIGIVTGEISGIIAFDEDGPEAEEFVNKQGGFPETPRSQTAHGFHNILKHPDFKVTNSSDKKVLLDVRGNGGYIVVPPSIHPSGHQYQWLNGLSPFEIDPAHLRPWMIQYLKDHFTREEDRIEIRIAPEDWEKAKREISQQSKIMLHLMTPKPEDRSGHDWRLACLCVENGITDPKLLYQIILNNPHGKAQSYPVTNKYIEALISRCLIQLTEEKRGKLSSSASFPEEIITGVAGDFTNLFFEHLESPRVFLFLGFLCCLGSILAGKLMLESERSFQTRLFLLLLGESADERKSTAIETPVDFFKEFFPNTLHTCWGVGSAEGLQSKIKDIPDGRLLLCLDEFKALISKCKIEGSVLLPCLNTLFEKNYCEAKTKTSDIRVENAYLSMLAASTTATYENLWTSQFIDIGFPNRIFIVPGAGERRHPLPKKVPYEAKQGLASEIRRIIQMVGNRLDMVLTQEGQEEYDHWYLSLSGEKTVHAKRLDTYALRFMPLLAVNDMKNEIDIETVVKTITLIEWQRKTRELLDPIDATNEIARMEEKIRRRLMQFPHTVGELKHFTKVKKTGLWVFNTAVKNLSEGMGKEISFNSKIKKWELLNKVAPDFAPSQITD